jgi:hypothetical protein
MSSTKRYSVVKAIPGNYSCSKRENGNTQIRVGVQIVEGPRTGEELSYWCTISDYPDSKKWAAQALRNFGMTNNDITAPEGLGSVKASMCEVFETWNGESKWKAKYINEHKPRKAKLDPLEIEEFNDLMADAFADAEVVEVNDFNKAPESVEAVAADDF